MKKRYHIAITEDNLRSFEDAASALGVDSSFTSKLTSTAGWTRYDYVMELSKYELLYLRLVCPMEKLVDISDVKPNKLIYDGMSA